jgi:hypothetical protein
MEKVENEQGIYRVKKGESIVQPLEKEIVIELPLPKNQWRQETLLELMARDCEEHQFSALAETYRVPLEKLRETRTIKIRGKNIDDLDLKNLANLIQQANEKSSKINLKGFLKNLKRRSYQASTCSET